MKLSQDKNSLKDKREDYSFISFISKLINIYIPLLLSTISNRRFSCNAVIEVTIVPNTSYEPSSTMNKMELGQVSSYSTGLINALAPTTITTSEFHSSTSRFLGISRGSRAAAIGICIGISLQFSACSKLIEVDPPIQSIVGQEIYSSTSTASSVLTGIYTDMSYYGIFSGRSSLAISLGLSADEFTSTALPTDILHQFYVNGLTKEDGGIWSNLYGYIFRCNSAIEGITASSGITEPAKSQLLGEAKFIRAFMYFYLVNLYGDVPLILTTDINSNITASRTDRNTVYESIITDLKDAQALMQEDYLNANMAKVAERVRPNSFSATALLARVYLYNRRWALAEQESGKLINNNATYVLEEIGNAFQTTSKEAIWQLQPVAISFNTLDAVTFVLDEGNGVPAGPNTDNRPVYLSEEIYNSFEPGDLRRASWIDSVLVGNEKFFFPYKYKVWLHDEPRTESLIVLRLAEQYLIRAEARAELGKLTGSNSALEDLNTIRDRAQLENAIQTSAEELKSAILHERKVEFFSEWGHRWLDLKRTGKIDEVMQKVTPKKGGNWSNYRSLFPIPVSDIQKNPSFRGHQNAGYPES